MFLSFALAANCDPLPPVDYTSTAAWLCRPGRPDACGAPIEVLDYLPDGRLRPITFAPPAALPRNADLDCFYVYPTVDLRLGAGRHEDLEALDRARMVTRAQAAPLVQACRVWAPAYRQVRIGTYFTRDVQQGCFDGAYADVAGAFEAFLAEIGDRPYALVGHSQGGQIVSRLVRERVEPDPALHERLVGAWPLGWQVGTAPGARTGGSFVETPTCAAPDEVGCAVAFRSHVEGEPRPAEGRFREGDAEVCVAPGADDRLDGVVVPRWGGVLDVRGLDVPSDRFVLVRDAYTGRCVADGPDAAFAVAWAPTDGDQRRDLLRLDRKRWRVGGGTHILDVSLVMLDLVGDLRRRATAWWSRHGA